MTQEETKTSDEVTNNDEFESIRYNIKNPWVILVGISKYVETERPNLEGSINSVKNMYQLFKNMYGYKHVYQFVDSLEYTRNDKVKKTKNVTPKHLDFFLQDHRSRINKINLSNDDKQDKIDSLIFYYCGHDDSEFNIIASDDAYYNRSNLHSIFNNEGCTGLRSLPKIYIYDDCPNKKGQQLFEEKIGVTSEKNNESKTDKKNENKTVTSTTLEGDQFFWFASPRNTSSNDSNDNGDENKNKAEKIYSGFFTTEIYKSMSHMLKNQKDLMLQGDLSTLVHKRVMKVSNSKQLPISTNKLQYEVYFSPSDTSPYKPENLWKECLNSWGLSKYANQFKKEAYDDINNFKTITKEECLKDIKMDKNDIEKFISSRDSFFD